MDKIQQILEDLRKSEVKKLTADTIGLVINIIESQDVNPYDGLSLAGAFNRVDNIELHAAVSSLLAMIISLKQNVGNLNKLIQEKSEITFSDLLNNMFMSNDE